MLGISVILVFLSLLGLLATLIFELPVIWLVVSLILYILSIITCMIGVRKIFRIIYGKIDDALDPLKP